MEVTHVIRSDQALTVSAEADLERRLRALPPAPGPDARFRAELRTQLLAAVERGPIADSFAVDRARGSVRPRPRFAPAARRAAEGLLGKFLHPGRRALGILSAAMAVALVVTGTTYWLAQRALPGDALYGLKRAGESVDLSTKGGDVSRGSAYLSISSTRIDEAFELVKRETSAATPGAGHGSSGISAAGPLSAHVDQLVHGVLTDGDTAAVTATKLLTTASVSNRVIKPASTVTTWLADQHSKVGDLVQRLPETAPSTAGGAARHLQLDLSQIQTRVKAIAASVNCGTCGFTKPDKFGPLPCRLLCPSPAPTSMAPTTLATRPPTGTGTGTVTSGRPLSTVVIHTTAASPTVVPSPPGPVATSGAGTTGAAPTTVPTPTPPLPQPPATTTTTAPPTTTPTPSPLPPPLTTTDTPPTTDPLPTTTAPTTDDPTVPSLPTCLPIICTDSSAAAKTDANAVPSTSPSS
jgi:Domain of unknown function (DUF5667)